MQEMIQTSLLVYREHKLFAALAVKVPEEAI